MSAVSKRPSRALIAYTVLAEGLQAHGDPFQALIPFIAPIAHENAGKLFDPVDLAKALRHRYSLNVPTIVADGLADHMVKGALLASTGTNNRRAYHYLAQVPPPIEPPDELAEEVLSEFRNFARQQNIPQTVTDPDLDAEFFARLIDIGSLRLLRRPDKTITAKERSSTLTLKTGEEPRDPGVEEPLDYVTAQFILYAAENSPELFDRLRRVALGNLVAEALVTFTSPPPSRHGLANLTVYLDAPLIMDIMGINTGMERFGQEILQLFNRAGVELKCFLHTIDEIEGAIRARLNPGVGPTHPLATYEPEPPVALAKLRMFRGNETHLIEEHFGIHLVDAPGSAGGLDRRWTAEVEAMIRPRIIRKNPEAQDADIASIRNLVRLRARAQPHLFLHDERHLMVSTNGPFVSTANRAWFELVREEYGDARARRSVPLFITAKQFAGLAWLLHGGESEEVLRQQLIGTCLAAIHPRKDVATKTFNLLLDIDPATAKEFEAIMTDARAMQMLNDRAWGMTETVTAENVHELYETVRREVATEVTEEQERLRKVALAEQRAQFNEERETFARDLENATTATLNADLRATTAEKESAERAKALEAREVAVLSHCFKWGCRAGNLAAATTVAMVTAATWLLPTNPLDVVYVPAAFMLVLLTAVDSPEWFLGRLRAVVETHVRNRMAQEVNLQEHLSNYRYDRDRATVVRLEQEDNS